MSEIAKGYKKTEVGVIPEDWEVKELGEIILKTKLGGNYSNTEKDTGLPLIKMGNISRGNINLNKIEYIKDESEINKDDILNYGDVLFNTRNTLELVGKVAIWKNELSIAFYNSNLLRMEFKKNIIASNFYMNYIFNNQNSIKQLKGFAIGTTSVAAIYNRDLYKMLIPIPPLQEQKAIAEALSDVDSLISSLEKLIDKKKKIKEGAMQELLTGKKRLEGFSGEWEVKRLGEIVDVLDNFRKPLNENERQKMKGNIPYCGANGVVGYVDDYIIDDEIILIAEDGGYFDEYKTRPIAYKMTGKCWVNNHAHILKSKIKIDQNFIFYSIVNKNILDFITGGTRAKLNKSQLIKIEIFLPKEKEEQTAIANILSDMDSEISSLETKLEKYKQIKQGMMQELLTGRIRLV